MSPEDFHDEYLNSFVSYNYDFGYGDEYNEKISSLADKSIPKESSDKVLVGWRAWRLFNLYYNYLANKPPEFLSKTKKLTKIELKSLDKKLLQSTYEDSIWRNTRN